ncbi:MAG: DUF2325 domain-containing protein [Bacillota bacterium]|nr:DUF2325 domain-containing protein [Bacillota bacterium]
MGVLVVGGDNIEEINYHLNEKGFFIIKHITGRKNSHKYVEIPKDAELVIILVDFVNHKLCEHIKKESKKLGIKTLYSKRSWASVGNLL